MEILEGELRRRFLLSLPLQLPRHKDLTVIPVGSLVGREATARGTVGCLEGTSSATRTGTSPSPFLGPSCRSCFLMELVAVGAPRSEGRGVVRGRRRRGPGLAPVPCSTSCSSSRWPCAPSPCWRYDRRGLTALMDPWGMVVLWAFTHSSKSKSMHGSQVQVHSRTQSLPFSSCWWLEPSFSSFCSTNEKLWYCWVPSRVSTSITGLW